ncbi:putative aryl-alcohol dehydrogenase aad14 [Exophiala xenobiotica]|uniref:Aryl-alcohol dehydrogenase aad14 n=1 Tax=Lithohypha guttulata TaxID=1690604 RepID=A0ABR0K9W7_9EURO|nr:putative aryl-alcohol dehydrogenase aad14 [Lithohypha guttulata]KAK5328171.1 putative aryl-alcohol dehydrogenase aad14 [Exophiala xenobiotica]
MGNHKKAMMLFLRNSLAKLQKTYIDIFYVHMWDHSSSIKEIMDSLHILVEQEKALYLDVSDTQACIVTAAIEYAYSNGKTPFSIYQGKWSVMRRDFERDILPMARHYGMALPPRGAMGQGKFQTKSQMEERGKSGEGFRLFPGSGQTEDEVKISAALENIAGELNARAGQEKLYSISAIALAYVLTKAPRVFPIVGGRRVEHLMANIRALEIRSSKERILELEGALPLYLGFPMDFIGEDPKVSGTKGGHVLAAGAYLDWQMSEKLWAMLEGAVDV